MVSGLISYILDIYLVNLVYLILKYLFIIVIIILKAIAETDEVDQNKKYDNNYLNFIYGLNLFLFEIRFNINFVSGNLPAIIEWFLAISIGIALIMSYKDIKKKIQKELLIE